MTNQEKAEIKKRLVAAIAVGDTKAISQLKKELRGEIRVLRTLLDFLMVTDAMGSDDPNVEYVVDESEGSFTKFIQERGLEEQKEKSNNTRNG